MRHPLDLVTTICQRCQLVVRQLGERREKRPTLEIHENSGCGIDGGGILNYGALTIDNSTISGNSVTVAGCFVVMTHCAAVGGGISSNGGSVTINNSTISGNSPDGIVGTATLQNSIVATTTGANCSGTVISHGYNLSSDGSCDFNAHGD